MRFGGALVGGVLMLLAAGPANATWVPVTAVPLDARPAASFVDASQELPGRVEAISLRAGRSDVMCRSIDGQFRSGISQELFRGLLRAGHEQVIQLLPVHRDIARIDLHCRAADGGAADVDIAADIAAD